MPNRNRAALRLATPRLFLASLVVVACACNGQSTTTPESQETPVLNQPQDGTATQTSETLPSSPPGTTPDADESAFEQAFGFELATMGEAVLRAQADYVTDCMTKRGYDYSPDTALETALPRATTEDYVANKITLIEEDKIRPQADQDQSDQYEIAVGECLVEAEQALPNPNMTMLGFVSQLSSDVSTRAKADPRLIDANQRRADCISAVGYPTPDGIDPTASLANDADILVIDYQTGQLAKTELITKLQALLPVERELAKCVTEYVEVEQVVTDELWAEALNDNPNLVQQVNEATKDEIALYEDYLTN